jgi:F-type H+-transporting ATPase subunit b
MESNSALHGDKSPFVSIPIGNMIATSLRLVPALVLFSVSPAAAAEGGLLTPNGGLIFWTILTFLIVLAALWKFAWPHILGAVEAREQRIRELLAAAERDREEAQALLAQQRADLEQNRARAQEILAESRTASERMREELLGQTRREQEELLVRARADIEHEMQLAIATVRAEAVDLAIAAAEKVIAANLDTNANRRLVQDFLGQVETQRPSGALAGV